MADVPRNDALRFLRSDGAEVGDLGNLELSQGGFPPQRSEE